jgi:FMN reductase
MRPLFAYLKAVTVPTAVFAASEDFGSSADGRLQDRIAIAADELAALVAGGAGVTPAAERAARGVRGREATADDVLDGRAEVTPFAELLRR